MAAMMSDSCRHRQASMVGVGGPAPDAARAGCFIRSAAAVTSSNGAIVSSLAASRIAPRTSPSASLLDTLAARLSDVDDDEEDDLRIFVGLCCCGAADAAGKLAMAAFILDARLLR